MPKWLKVVLIIFGVLAVLTALCIGGGAWWFNANKGDLMAAGNKAKAEGESFGKQSTDDGCVDESLERLNASHGLMDEVGIKIFLATCVDVAAPSPAFCTDVPPKGEIMQGVAWASTVCTQRGAKDAQACGRLVQAVQDHCAKKKR